MKVYVVIGWNGPTHCAGPVGAAKTPEKAEEIKAGAAWYCDESKVFELELEE